MKKTLFNSLCHFVLPSLSLKVPVTTTYVQYVKKMFCKKEMRSEVKKGENG